MSINDYIVFREDCTDAEKASIISDLQSIPLKQRHKMLAEIRDTTSDMKLKSKIRRYVNRESEFITKFMNKSDGYIYTLGFWGAGIDPNANKCDEFYMKYEYAFHHGEKSGRPFWIERKAPSTIECIGQRDRAYFNIKGELISIGRNLNLGSKVGDEDE